MWCMQSPHDNVARVPGDRGDQEFLETEETKSSWRQRRRRVPGDRGDQEFLETEETKSGPKVVTILHV